MEERLSWIPCRSLVPKLTLRPAILRGPFLSDPKFPLRHTLPRLDSQRVCEHRSPSIGECEQLFLNHQMLDKTEQTRKRSECTHAIRVSIAYKNTHVRKLH